MREVVLPNWRPIQGEAQGWIGFDADGGVYEGDSLWTRAADDEKLRHRLQQLTQLVLTENSTHVTFLHAGVVRFRERLVMIPGPSKSGKSSLVQALVQAGGRFYSDEFAVLDDRGLAHSYPRPMWTRVTRKQRKPTPASELGWSAELGPEPLRVLLLTEYQPGAHWDPRRLSLDEAIHACLEQVQGPHRETARRRLQRALQECASYRGVRGEASEVVRWLSDQAPGLHR